MGKGQRHNLERLLRSAWERQQQLQARDVVQRADQVIEAPKEKSLLSKFFDWEGVSFATLALTGLTLLTIPHGYPVARICFIGAAASLVIKLTLGVKTAIYPKILIGVLASIVAGIGVDKVNDWVASVEVEEASKSQLRTILLQPRRTPTAPDTTPIRSELGKLLARNNEIRETCQRDALPKGFSCWAEWIRWRDQARKYLSKTTEPSYLARFRATTGTHLLYKKMPSGRFLDEGPESDSDAMNLLTFSAATLDQFIKELHN
jgi:hypothetical protein